MWERYLSSMSEFLLFLTDSETTESAYGVAYCRFSLLAMCLVSLVFPMLKFYTLANTMAASIFFPSRGFTCESSPSRRRLATEVYFEGPF